jgi:hypothetical protein
MYCARNRFGGKEGFGSRFHVLRSRNHFQRSRVRRVPFSCFARPDSFSAVPMASGPIIMFCSPRLIFGGSEGLRSRFHVFLYRTYFGGYRGRRVPFSFFALLESFSEVPSASGPVLMFCTPGHVFGGTEGVGSRLYVLRSRTRSRRYRGRRVPFSCFALPKSFSEVPSASGPVFMFCAPELVFGETEGAGSNFHVLRSRTRFQRYRGRRVPFSCFARPDSFSDVSRASGPVFMFCAPELIFDGSEGFGSRFHVFCARTCIGGKEEFGSRFHVLRSRNHS